MNTHNSNLNMAVTKLHFCSHNVRDPVCVRAKSPTNALRRVHRLSVISGLTYQSSTFRSVIEASTLHPVRTLILSPLPPPSHTNVYHCFCSPFSVIAIAKISRIRNHGSVVVYQIRKSVFSIWAERGPTWKIFHYVCIWCPMNTNN